MQEIALNHLVNDVRMNTIHVSKHLHIWISTDLLVAQADQSDTYVARNRCFKVNFAEPENELGCFGRISAVNVPSDMNATVLCDCLQHRSQLAISGCQTYINNIT